MLFILSGFLVYISFFIIFPGYGAISLRRRWEKFRDLILKSSIVPVLEYDNIKEGESYSFKGELESFKDDDTIWLKGENLSIMLNLNNRDLYTLSRGRSELIKTGWDSISSLVEGTTFFVFGELKFIDGSPYLKEGRSDELLVVVSDEDSVSFETLLQKGRNKNEMWNSYTPYSYITGVLCLIIFSYFSYSSNSNKIISYLLLVAAGTPFYFIIPPGLFFYLKYRRQWDKSLRWSVLRDLKKLKGDFYGSDKMQLLSKSRERISLLYYVAGYILNISIAAIIIFQLYKIIIYR